jgi:uncharacterized protein with PIN domain
MTYLRWQGVPATAACWVALSKDHREAPAASQEVARGDSSVVCDPAEAAAAASLARRHSAWLEEPAPMWIGTA